MPTIVYIYVSSVITMQPGIYRYLIILGDICNVPCQNGVTGSRDAEKDLKSVVKLLMTS